MTRPTETGPDPQLLKGDQGEPPLDHEQMAKRTNLAPRALDVLAHRGYLVCAYLDDRALYPVWGLDPPVSAQEGIALLLTVFGQHRRAEWIRFLRTRQSGLEGQTPMDWLRAGRSIRAIVRLAERQLVETAWPRKWDPQRITPPELSLRALIGLQRREDEPTTAGIYRLPEDSFFVWAGNNQPDSKSRWTPAWWNYIDAVRRLTGKWEVDEADVVVVGEYLTRTPPPVEGLRLPVGRWPVEGTVFTVAWHFVHPAPEWTVSVERPEPYRGSLHGLFDPELDLSGQGVSGLGGEYSFPPFSTSPDRFTCRVDDMKDVATLIRLMVVP